MTSNLAVGVFDSGVGGLTVLKALKSFLPHEDMLYLGDTARLPYGTKNKSTVSRYAVQAVAKLVERKVKYLVIACNTVTAAALPELRQSWPNIPIIGVVEPGARVAVQNSKKGKIAVIATESTIANGAYQKAILKLNPKAEVVSKACSLLIPLAEEGWFDGEIVEAVLKRYLSFLDKLGEASPDCLVLGCTHFPIFAESIKKVLNNNMAIVDSAQTTAAAVGAELKASKLLNTQLKAGQVSFMTTDDIERFARVGSLFLQQKIEAEMIELVNL